MIYNQIKFDFDTCSFELLVKKKLTYKKIY